MSEENKKANEVEETVTDNETVEEIFAEDATSADQGDAIEQDTNEQQLAQAEEKIQTLAAKVEELENRNLRLQADMDNLRRRAKLDLEAAHKYRVQSLASELITSLDNFERALGVSTDNEETKRMLQGLEMVYKSMMNALQKEGVEPIEAVGQEFDPNFHQAVMQTSDENYPQNHVIEELQKGYKLKDRVLRPSMVKVNQ
ncbi:MAG: nucleotide exchange factor GrpE [Bacillus sp. (in: firmicutes)]